MQASDIPYKFAEIWASLAAGGFATDPIPVNSTGALAGQDLGFPPITAVDPGAGGIPPDIKDFNGAYKYVTAWLRWMQAGAPIFYDAAFSAAIGGYPTGGVLRVAADANQTWITTSDNNVTDPDTGGAGWYCNSLGRLAGPPIVVGASTGSLTGLPPGTNRAIIVLLGGGGAGGAVPGTGASQAGAASGGTAGARVAAYIPAGVTGAAIVIGSTSGDTIFTAAGGSPITAKGGPQGISTGLLSTTGGVSAIVRGIYSSGSTPVGSLGVFEQDDGILGGDGFIFYPFGVSGVPTLGYGGVGGVRPGYGTAGLGNTNQGLPPNTSGATGRGAGGGGGWSDHSNGGGSPGGGGTNGLCIVFPLS